MGWPDSGMLWREDAKPAQKQYADVAKAISQFEPVVMMANPEVRSPSRPHHVCPADSGIQLLLCHCWLSGAVIAVTLHFSRYPLDHLHRSHQVVRTADYLVNHTWASVFMLILLGIIVATA